MTEVTEEMVEAFYKAHDASLEDQPREGHQAVYDGIAAVLKVAALSASAEPGVGDEIADAVLSWMVEYDLLDAGNEYRASDVLAVLGDLVPSAQCSGKPESRILSALHKESGETLPPVDQKTGTDWQAIAEHYRLALLDAEHKINAQPVKQAISGKDINETARFLTEITDALHEARMKVIFKQVGGIPPVGQTAALSSGMISVQLHQKIVNELGRIIGDLQAELDKGKTP